MKKIVRLTESDLARIIKRVINEQENTDGYEDITSWFFSDPGVVYIPDGEYKVDGWSQSGKIKTMDGKDTGYMIYTPCCVRGRLSESLTVSKNGGVISYSDDIKKVMLNKKILESSGLKVR